MRPFGGFAVGGVRGVRVAVGDRARSAGDLCARGAFAASARNDHAKRVTTAGCTGGVRWAVASACMVGVVDDSPSSCGSYRAECGRFRLRLDEIEWNAVVYRQGSRCGFTHLCFQRGF